ncbi:hypothetical protein TanjilG_32093 [Lupinus angustifolius]|uniref:Fimbrial protein n=1 Tax=Lupinus angustifolius TaxID=3871 RepID=A0A4P1RFS0_LUPAN|nr:hypothetical protein TanjilG_32093 [Lupinus angustifolius]
MSFRKRFVMVLSFSTPLLFSPPAMVCDSGDAVVRFYSRQRGLGEGAFGYPHTH